jgi:hypothetical protein
MDEEFQTALQASLFTSVPGLEDLVSGPAAGHKQFLQFDLGSVSNCFSKMGLSPSFF